MFSVIFEMRTEEFKTDEFKKNRKNTVKLN